MLYIYDPLVGRIKRHLKKKNINADIDFNIGRNWHKYRYIQVFPKGLDSCIHYEYINHHWELHFEKTDSNLEAEELRQVMVSSIVASNNMGWHNWSHRQRGLLRLEEEVCDRTFESLFDSLWEATISILQNDNVSNEYYISMIESVAPSDAFTPICEYHKPDEPRIVKVEDLEYDRFTIPSYQRPYKWNIKNVNQLIDDVVTFCERGTREYRLGTLVLHKLSKGRSSEMEIVDGQQRSITLLLLLNELSKKEEFADLFLPEFCDSMYAFLSKKQFHDSISKRHIQENINAIRFRIIELKKKHVRFLLSNCCFVVIALYDVSEAFQFFDSQNARGKELEPHDLLKAYHLREIPQLSNTDLQNITAWEKMDTPYLASLFLMLFRVKRWIEAKNGRFFTSNAIDTFKGYSTNQSQLLPYQRIFLMADCYIQIYNNDIYRKLDRQHMEYPHQIDQATINGSLFFDMIRYYSEKHKELPNLVEKYSDRIWGALDSYPERHRDGDKFTKMLFDAALLFYYDKFGIDGIDKAIIKIFLWSYAMRLTHNSVKRTTMDNYAREENSAFRIIHSATKPLDLQNWQLPIIKATSIKQKGMESIKEIFINLHQIESEQ